MRPARSRATSMRNARPSSSAMHRLPKGEIRCRPR
jgi:hypothetical protein